MALYKFRIIIIIIIKCATTKIKHCFIFVLFQFILQSYFSCAGTITCTKNAHRYRPEHTTNEFFTAVRPVCFAAHQNRTRNSLQFKPAVDRQSATGWSIKIETFTEQNLRQNQNVHSTHKIKTGKQFNKQ